MAEAIMERQAGLPPAEDLEAIRLAGEAQSVMIGNIVLAQEAPAVDSAVEAVTARYDAQPSRFDKLRKFAQRGAATALGSVALFNAAPALAHESATDSHAAAKNPVAHTATVPWLHYGGDPLFPGGVHSRSEFVKQITSAKGHEALMLAGDSPAEIKALDKAARQGKETKCHKPFGFVVEKMSFSNPVRVESNAKFLDTNHPNGFDGYCLSAKIVKSKHVTKEINGHKVKGIQKTTETISNVDPTECSNLGLVGRKFKTTFKAIKKKVSPKKANVKAFKHALNEFGTLLTPTPTGIFQFTINCLQNGKKFTRTAIYTRPHQTLASCDVGTGKNKVVEVIEGPTLGPDKWFSLSPDDQKQLVKPKGNEFVFKDQEAPKTCADQPEAVVCLPPPNTTVQPKCTDTHSAEECAPKTDGPQGAGAGTPGNGTGGGGTVDGPGAGGNGGNPNQGKTCYDTNDTQDGDQDPNTGAPGTERLMYQGAGGADINNTCIGKADGFVQS